MPGGTAGICGAGAGCATDLAPGAPGALGALGLLALGLLALGLLALALGRLARLAPAGSTACTGALPRAAGAAAIGTGVPVPVRGAAALGAGCARRACGRP